MTFTRVLKKGNNVYLYRVRTYRDKATGKVKQETKYLGKRVEKDGKITLIEPRRKAGVRRVLDSAGYIMFSVAEKFGIVREFNSAVANMTKISRMGDKILILAIHRFVGTSSVFIHTSIKEEDFSEKKTRDIIDFLGKKDPDIISILEKSIAPKIIKEYGNEGVVYDLSAITYFGHSNNLARYGYYYDKNGKEKEINFVMAVTKSGGVPIHHHDLHGNIVSVSTLKRFTNELNDYGIVDVLIVIDRGVYSSDNIEELKEFEVIGAIPSHLNIYNELILKCKGIDNSRNYFRYNDKAIFYKEFEENEIRYLVYFSPRKRADRIDSFYSGINEIEEKLKELQKNGFGDYREMVSSVNKCISGYSKFFKIKFSRNSFSYFLRHKAIQRRTNRMGFTVLFTTTDIDAMNVLRIYRQKDVVEKAFMHVKPIMEPIYSRTEEGTRARMFLSVLAYSIMAIMMSKTGLTYNNLLETIFDIREVVYTNGSHISVELTKQQKELLEKLSVDL